MMCPMRNGPSGGIWDCKEAVCAWWNKETKQCAIVILAQAAKTIENKRILIEKE